MPHTISAVQMKSSALPGESRSTISRIPKDATLAYVWTEGSVTTVAVPAQNGEIPSIGDIPTSSNAPKEIKIVYGNFNGNLNSDPRGQVERSLSRPRKMRRKLNPRNWESVLENLNHPDFTSNHIPHPRLPMADPVVNRPAIPVRSHSRSDPGVYAPNLVLKHSHRLVHSQGLMGSLANHHAFTIPGGNHGPHARTVSRSTAQVLHANAIARSTLADFHTVLKGRSPEHHANKIPRSSQQLSVLTKADWPKIRSKSLMPKCGSLQIRPVSHSDFGVKPPVAVMKHDGSFGFASSFAPEGGKSVPIKYTFKPYKRHRCSRCPKTFTTRFGLTRHLRTHTNERPFSCEICSRKFRQKAHVVTHMVAIHPNVKIEKQKTNEITIGNDGEAKS